MPRKTNGTVTIKMKKTEQGSPDGLVTNTYLEDKVYTVPSELGKVFIAIESAVIHKGDSEDEDAPNPGEATGALVLPEGMVTREALVKDEWNNKELIEYAEAHLEVEKNSIKMNTKHSTLLQSIIDMQRAWEEVELVKQANAQD